MTTLQLELTRLIGKEELTFGCEVTVESSKWQKRTAKIVDYTDWWEDGYFATFVSNGNIMTHTLNNRAKSQWDIEEIIGHPATLSDFHRFLKSKKIWFYQDEDYIKLEEYIWSDDIDYDSGKDLLDQSEETLKQIVELIKSNQ